MIVTFISQCEKKALARTRRVLDAFANRIGDNTWQTVITEEGLLAVKKLLRQSATKSTAVACHRIKTRTRSELQWVVGNRSKFNNQGIVPVNWTKKDVFMDVTTMKPKQDEFYANTHLQPLAEFRHTFSHYHLMIKPVRVYGEFTQVLEQMSVWQRPKQAIEELGLPMPMQKILAEI
jgi:CRISPR-associated endonuclease/helicase Cas3